jgi:hypothetical protein
MLKNVKSFARLAIFIAILFFVTGTSCEKDSDCGTYNGHQLHRGTQGGCYYHNSSGNKVYVDRSYCDC